MATAFLAAQTPAARRNAILTTTTVPSAVPATSSARMAVLAAKTRSARLKTAPTEIWRTSAKPGARPFSETVSSAAQTPTARKAASTRTTTAHSVARATFSVRMDVSTARMPSAAATAGTMAEEQGGLFISPILSRRASKFSSRQTNSVSFSSHLILSFQVFVVFHTELLTLVFIIESGSTSFSVLNGAGYAIWKDEVYSFGGYVPYGVKKTRILKLMPSACEFQLQSVTLKSEFGASWGSIALVFPEKTEQKG